MIRRIAVLMAVLTLASATSALAATADRNCTLVGAGAEYRDQRTDPGAVDGPSELCELLNR